MINRLVDLPGTRSFFLFGPRQTGKSTLIHAHLAGTPAWSVDLLRTEQFLKYAKQPDLFRKEVEVQLRRGVQTIFIDEVQKVPLLLDEVHALIHDHRGTRFILTGSSARKLRHGAANLLAGRLLRRTLHPFAAVELGDTFDLEEALRFGTLPALHGQTLEEKQDTLSAYTETYLREEVQAEGLVRNLGGFSRFLDVAAAQSGELVNFSSVARDAGLPNRTVQAYFEILEDTLIAFRLEAWRHSPRKRLTLHPKYYLFDTGVTNAINRRLSAPPDPTARGRLFEQWIVLETLRRLSFKPGEERLFYWRTSGGAEVDLLIERGGKLLAACEVKAGRTVAPADTSGLRAFREDHPGIALYVVADVSAPYALGEVLVLPWREYLQRLSAWDL